MLDRSIACIGILFRNKNYTTELIDGNYLQCNWSDRGIETAWLHSRPLKYVISSFRRVDAAEVNIRRSERTQDQPAECERHSDTETHHESHKHTHRKPHSNRTCRTTRTDVHVRTDIRPRTDTRTSTDTGARTDIHARTDTGARTVAAAARVGTQTSNFRSHCRTATRTAKTESTERTGEA